MNKKRQLFKIAAIFLIFLFCFSFCYIYADDIDLEEDPFLTQESSSEIAEEVFSNNQNTLQLNSRSCIVLDRVSKKILFGKNELNKVKMASTTKIMTATVILEKCNLDDTVIISKKAAGTGGSRLGLKTGDKITIRDLLYGLMLRSGNDAAVALAEIAGGSISGFSDLMNQKAKELNLINSHFESPHGLDSDGHYTTAYELSLLADYALKNPVFSQIVGSKNYTITINGYPKVLSNTNELLGNLTGVYGVKTGFTNGANRCLVSSCKRNNMDIITVVLGADTKKFRTQDSMKLIEYAFKNFEYVNIQDKINHEFADWKTKNSNSFLIEKGNPSQNLTLKLSSIENPTIPVQKDLIPTVTVSILANKQLLAPLNINDKIGIIEVRVGENVISSCDILVETKISKKDILYYFIDFLKNFKNEVNFFNP